MTHHKAAAPRSTSANSENKAASPRTSGGKAEGESKITAANASSLKAFLMYIERDQGFSPHSVKNYSRALDVFLEFVGRRDVQKIDHKVLRAYKESIAKKQVNYKTKNLMISPVRSFLSFLNTKGANISFRDHLEVFRSRNGVTEVKIPTKEEVKKFLAKTDDDLSDVAVELLYDTGLRLAEMLSLSVGEVQEKFTIRGKGAKPRLVIVSPEIVKMVRKFEGDRKGRLFDVSPVVIQRRLVERSEKTGVKMTPHTLRHAYASSMLDSGADLRVVQSFLGHSSIATTQRYAHVSDPMLEEAHKRFASRK